MGDGILFTGRETRHLPPHLHGSEEGRRGEVALLRGGSAVKVKFSVDTGGEGDLIHGKLPLHQPDKVIMFGLVPKASCGPSSARPLLSWLAARGYFLSCITSITPCTLIRRRRKVIFWVVLRDLIEFGAFLHVCSSLRVNFPDLFFVYSVISPDGSDVMLRRNKQ